MSAYHVTCAFHLCVYDPVHETQRPVNSVSPPNNGQQTGTRGVAAGGSLPSLAPVKAPLLSSEEPAGDSLPRAQLCGPSRSWLCDEWIRSDSRLTWSKFLQIAVGDVVDDAARALRRKGRGRDQAALAWINALVSVAAAAGASRQRGGSCGSPEC